MTDWTFTSIIVITINLVLAIALLGSLPVVYQLRHTFRGVARSMTDLADTLGDSLHPAPEGLKQASQSIQTGRQSLARFKRSTRLVNGILQSGQWAIARWIRK